MSKLRNSMHQPHEFPQNADTQVCQIVDLIRVLLQRGVACTLIGCFAACGSPKHPTSELKGSNPQYSNHDLTVLRRGLPGEPQTLDPQLAEDTYSLPLVRDLYEGLTAEDNEGNLRPGVAESWSVDPTGKIYSFKLRSNAKWSNGDRVTAHEFVEGLRRAVDPKTGSGSSSLLGSLENAGKIGAGTANLRSLGVTAPDDLLLQIRLAYPAPYILHILSQPVAAPKHLERISNTLNGSAIRVTNGPYMLAQRIPGAYIDLLKNPHYWDSAHVALVRVRYVEAESETTELHEYLAGQLDMTFTVPTPDLNRLIDSMEDQVQMAPILAVQYLALNLTQSPLPTDSRIRQALSMSVNRNAIAKNVVPGVTPAYSLTAHGLKNYSAPEYSWKTFSDEERLTEARKLMTEAGYSKAKPLRLKVYFNSGESIQRMMTAITTEWKQELGVIAEIKSDEFRVFLSGRKDRHQWDVTRLGWNADYEDPISFLEVFLPGSMQNDPGYSNPIFSDYLRQAKDQSESKVRLDLLYKAEQVLLNDYPIIPIYFYNARRLVKPYVGGAKITPLNATYSKYLFWKTDSFKPQRVGQPPNF